MCIRDRRPTGIELGAVLAAATVEPEKGPDQPANQRRLSTAVGTRDDHRPVVDGNVPLLIVTAVAERQRLEAGSQHQFTSSARSAARSARWATVRLASSAA